MVTHLGFKLLLSSSSMAGYGALALKTD